MIVLLGATGYIGEAFVAELRRRQLPFTAVPHRDLDGTRFAAVLEFLRNTRPAFLINAAGFAGKPNVDACELARAETLQGNTLLPVTLAHACLAAGVPWGHVSSGCIYSGAWVTTNGQRRLETDLACPKLRAVIDPDPSAVRGFTEEEEPNFSFRRPPCSFYSGTKALAEESIAGVGQSYIWRTRIPFDQMDHPRNVLSKLQRYARVYDNINSISHRGDFVRACLDLWSQCAPFGIYNLTNPCFVTTRRIIELIEQRLQPARTFEFWSGDEEFYRLGVKTPRSNCVLDVAKALATGIRLRPVEEALDDALLHWTGASAA